MANVCFAFEVLKSLTLAQMREGRVKPGFRYFVTHIIFDIKMYSKFTCKARLVIVGHKAASPTSITYYTIVIRDILRMEFLIACLNNLDICACGIVIAYPNDTC